MTALQRKDLRAGDIVLCAAASCNSRCTRCVCMLEYSSVQIILPLRGELVAFEQTAVADRDVVFKRRFSGVRAVPLGCKQHDVRERQVVIRTDMTGAQVDLCLSVCRFLYGRPHNWWASMCSPCLWLLDCVRSSDQCSEFVGQVLEAADLQWMRFAPYNRPEFLHWLSKHVTHTLDSDCDMSNLPCVQRFCPTPNVCCGSIDLADLELDGGVREDALDFAFGCAGDRRNTHFPRQGGVPLQL
jgi:hypothetical protein